MIFTENTNDFRHKFVFSNFDKNNVFLVIATNLPMLLKTGFVVQGHIWLYISIKTSELIRWLYI